MFHEIWNKKLLFVNSRWQAHLHFAAPDEHTEAPEQNNSDYLPTILHQRQII